MGKIRVKTIGIDEEENKEKKKAKQRAEAKRAEKQVQASAEPQQNETPKDAGEKGEDQRLDQQESAPSEKKPKKQKFKKKARVRSKTYTETAKLIDKNKKYTLKEALDLLPKLKRTKFDETVELHINTIEQGVSGNLTLPHGTGKKMRVEIADNTNDPKALQELVKKIESGKIDFDILIATPDSMTHLAKVARFLGPKGLMPNPKNGTVNPKPKDAAKKFEGGQMNFKTEAKAPIIHMTVGKLSFEEKKLSENINAIFKAVQEKNIKNVTLKSTMSPGIKLSV